MYNYNHVQPVPDPAYAQYGAPVYYQAQPMMVPVAQQPPYVIVANPQPPVYAAPYYAPAPQHIYYQDVHGHQQQPAHMNPTTDSSVRPLLTSTPLPPTSHFAGPSHHRYGQVFDRGDHHMQHDVLAELSKISVGDDTVELSPEMKSSARRMPIPVPPNYKTKLCVNYATTGSCKMGFNCLFAHGQQERRGTLPRNPRFKTKLCKHYEGNELHSSNGSYDQDCPYGSRCEFIHPADREFRTLPRRVQLAVSNLLHKSGSSHNDQTPDQSEKALPTFSRSAANFQGQKMTLTKRQIGGSLMCLATDDGIPRFGDCISRGIPGLKPSTSVMGLNKFARRRSVSNLHMASSLKRFNSMEHIRADKN